MKLIVVTVTALFLVSHATAQCGLGGLGLGGLGLGGGYGGLGLGGLGLGGCGGGCAPGPLPFGACGGCGATISCDPRLSQSILSPLTGPGSPFCGPCCDPISACLFKKLRTYSLYKKKCLADIIIKKNLLANKMLCGC